MDPIGGESSERCPKPKIPHTITDFDPVAYRESRQTNND